MSDVDRIIEQLLGDRRIREGATFSSRSYSDQPLIERGSDLKRRIERREAERAERRRREAEARQNRRDRAEARPGRQAQQAPQSSQMSAQQYRDLVLDLEQQELSFRQSNWARPVQPPAPAVEPRRERLPERIAEMRRLEHGGLPSTLAYGSSASGALFWRQAQLMADYEDDYDFQGTFSQYYPTYTSMSDRQLRGYFSWRTRVRAGQVDAAPLSFAFVYVYELLMGVGTTPGRQGLADLRAFGQAYRAADEMSGQRLAGYMSRWVHDYAVYHDIADELTVTSTGELASAVLTLLRTEHALLRKADTQPRIPNPAADASTPTRDQIFEALGTAGRYHITTSRLAKDEPELLAACACDVFAALVSHCAKRRKTDFVEGLFGYASEVPYTMFAAAVFWEPAPHDDCEVSVGEIATYVCRNGLWRRRLACEARDTNRDLGLAMHCCDYELRKQLDYPYPLKQRKAPKYLWKMVHDVVTHRLEERAEAERRRINIDLSKLGDIRAAAEQTQEALLTDEERDLPQAEPTVPWAEPTMPQASLFPAEVIDATGQSSVAQPAPVRPTATQPAVTAPSPAAPPSPAASSPESETVPNGLGLSPLELRFLTGLLAGTPASQLLSPTDPFASVVADSINDKLFDLIGDAVIEFDGDEPLIIEDYLEDIREVL